MLATLPATATAQIPIGQVAVSDSGDTAWMLTASVLVLMVALPGLALFYAGRASWRDALSVMAQIGAVAAIVSLLWIVVGYTLAFGGVSNGWIGSGIFWMLGNLGSIRVGTTVPESAFVLFQMSAALFAAALMTGAWVGRARFAWAVAFAALWSVAVYAPVTHWVWGGGWLVAGFGTIDFAGGLVIHTAAGVSALVTALLLGRRAPAYATRAEGIPALTIVGGALLWLGWFGLVGGSALTATDDAAAAIVNAHAAAATGALAWLALERLGDGRSSATGWAHGALAGLVTVSAAAAYVAPVIAMALGLIGALACHYTARFVRDVARIDDTLGVFAAHGVCGAVGTLLVAPALLPSLGGLGFVEGVGLARQVAAQGAGVLAVALYSAVVSAILALMVSVIFPMRVSARTEEAGLDLGTHGERAFIAE